MHMRRFFARLVDLVHGGRADADAAREIEAHLALLEEEYRRRGMSGDEARLAARRALGSVALAQDAHRDARSFAWVRDLRRDVHHAVRGLRRTPGFTAIAVLTLGVAIGANTTVFSIVSAALLRPLPYPEAQRLVALVTTTQEGSFPLESSRRLNLWRHQAQTFDAVAAYRVDAVNVAGAGEPEQVIALSASVDLFDLIGATAAAGRVFTADDDRPGGARVVVLSHGFWHRRFGGRGDAIGRSLRLDDELHVIVGVLRQEVRFGTLPLIGAWNPDVVVPLQLDPTGVAVTHYLAGLGRLRPGATLESARAAGASAFMTFRREFPGDVRSGEGVGVEPLREAVVGDVQRPLLLMAVAVGLVLLVACANVAGLLLVRAAARSRELTIRTALGASRARIVRQLLTESLVLSMLGAVVGILLAVAGTRGVMAVGAPYLAWVGPHGSSVMLDWRAVAFAAASGVVSAVVAGVMPALRGWRLRHIERPSLTSSPRARRTRNALVSVEMALACSLLIGAVLLVQSFIALQAVNPGFDFRNVVSAPMVLNAPRFRETSVLARLVREGVERVQAVPGVEAVAAGCCPPMLGRYGLSFTIVGRPVDGADHGLAGWVNVSPGYFDVFRIPLVRGRRFTELDTASAEGVVIVNETMARRLWPEGDPLNDRLTIGSPLAPVEERPRRIVGVVGDVRDGGLHGEPIPMMYVPIAQVPDVLTALHARVGITWFVRTHGETPALRERLERSLSAASGGTPIAATLDSVDDLVSDSMSGRRVHTLLMTAFAVIAVALTALGLYGLMSHAVAQRRTEIGIRMALGVRRSSVMCQVLREGAAVTGAGLVAGIGGAVALVRYLDGMLFGVTPLDPATFLIATVLLLTVACLASLVPARRATRVDPLVALRGDDGGAGNL